jgi:hypothetical protein
LAVFMAHRNMHRRGRKQRRAKSHRSAYQGVEVLEDELGEAVSGGGERRRQGLWVEGKGARRACREEALSPGRPGGCAGVEL